MTTLKELFKKATPLPWSVSTLMTAPQYETAARAWICPPPNGNTQNAVAGVIGTPDRGLSDAALIVHCVNNFAQVVGVLEQTRHELSVVRSCYKELVGSYDSVVDSADAAIDCAHAALAAAQNAPHWEKEGE